MLLGGLFSKRTVLVGLVLALSFLVALPSQAGSFEAVYLLKVMDLENKAVVVRANGDMYLIEYGIGVLSIWRYEGKAVYIYSPTLFAGIGSKIILPERGEEARIWNSEYLGNHYGSLAPAPPLPAPVAPPAPPPSQPGPAPLPPSPGRTKMTAVLRAGDPVMRVNEQGVVMDAVPYLKNSRVYVSARYCAKAFGIPDQNIVWDGMTGTATIIGGSRVVQMTVGSNVMIINGTSIIMDTVPEIVPPGRVMLPIGWLAQALGAQVAWDPATQTAFKL